MERALYARISILTGITIWLASLAFINERYIELSWLANAFSFTIAARNNPYCVIKWTNIFAIISELVHIEMATALLALSIVYTLIAIDLTILA